MRHGVRDIDLRHGVTTIVPAMSGPWIQQKNLYVPAFVNVT